MASEAQVDASQQTLSHRIVAAWKHGDRLYQGLILLATLLVLLLVVLIGYELWSTSDLSRKAFGLGFLTSTRWDPAIDREFGALPFIQGTLITSVLALIFAVYGHGRIWQTLYGRN